MLSPPAPTAETTPAPAPPRRRLPWAELGVEAFAVFLSVLAGFAVTAWVEARREQAQRAAALDGFAQELAVNRARVRERLPYHERIHDALDSLADAAGPAGLADVETTIPDWQGPQQVRFAQTARRAADLTGALALLDLETAGRLSDVHLAQDELLDVQRTVIEAGLNPAFFEGANPQGSLRALALYFDIVEAFEEELLVAYDAALERVAAVGGQAERARDG